MAELRSERRARRMTQAELGKRAGYHKNAIGEFELGRRRVFIHALDDMATALGLTLKFDRKSS